MNISAKHYITVVCLTCLLLIAACSKQSSDHADWDDMNYAAAVCGENSKGTFTSPNCKTKDDDLTALTGRSGAHSNR